MEDPDKYHREIAAFIGTRVPEPPKQDTFRIVLQQWRPCGLRVPELAMEIPSATYNKKYFDRWSYFLTRSPLKRYYRYIAKKYEPEFAKHGYSLIEGFIDDEDMLISDNSISALLGPVYCCLADVGALLRRSVVRSRARAKRAVKKLIPKIILKKIKQARQSAALSKGRAEVRA